MSTAGNQPGLTDSAQTDSGGIASSLLMMKDVIMREIADQEG
jgi:hypothetical protein